MRPFVPVTAQQLVFGYDDPLVSIAHQFFPKARRPMSQMGLLLGVITKICDRCSVCNQSTDKRYKGRRLIVYF